MALLVSTWHTSLTSVEESYFSHHGVYFLGSWKAGKGKTTLMAGRKYIVCPPSTRLSFFFPRKMASTRWLSLMWPYQDQVHYWFYHGSLGVFIPKGWNKWKMARHLHNLVVRKYFPSTLLVYYTFCLLDERSSWYNVYVTFLGIDCASWSTYLI